MMQDHHGQQKVTHNHQTLLRILLDIEQYTQEDMFQLDIKVVHLGET
jgi:hypothetical protein